MPLTVNDLIGHLTSMKIQGHGDCPVAMQDSSSKAIKPLVRGDIGILSDQKKYLIFFPKEDEIIAPPPKDFTP